MKPENLKRATEIVKEIDAIKTRLTLRIETEIKWMNGNGHTWATDRMPAPDTVAEIIRQHFRVKLFKLEQEAIRIGLELPVAVTVTKEADNGGL